MQSKFLGACIYAFAALEERQPALTSKKKELVRNRGIASTSPIQSVPQTSFALQNRTKKNVERQRQFCHEWRESRKG